MARFITDFAFFATRPQPAAVPAPAAAARIAEEEGEEEAKAPVPGAWGAVRRRAATHPVWKPGLLGLYQTG